MTETLQPYTYCASLAMTASKMLLQILGPGGSKITTSLVNVSLKFQMLVSQICHYFWLKKCEKLLQCKSFSHFVNKKKISVFGYKAAKTLKELTS